MNHDDKMEDYALPNDKWSNESVKLFNELNEMGSEWKKAPRVMRPGADGSRMFTNAAEPEKLFQYAFFYNLKLQHTKGVVYFGCYTEGNIGHVQGGAIATILDGAIGNCAIYCGYKSVTATLNVDYKRPIPVNTTTLVEAKVEKVEGRKVFLSGAIKSVDGCSVYSTAESLFIIPKLNILSKTAMHAADRMDDGALRLYKSKKEFTALFNQLSEMGSDWIARYPEKYNGSFIDAVEPEKFFQYVFFYNTKLQCVKAVVQFGLYTRNSNGHVHGGAIATILDSVMWYCVGARVCYTVNLNIEYKRNQDNSEDDTSPRSYAIVPYIQGIREPIKRILEVVITLRAIPLNTTALVEVKIDKIEGRKIFLSGAIKTVDGREIYSTGTSIYVIPKSTASL